MEFDHGTETISPDDTVTTITIGGTGGLILPSGNTAQRPTNVAGLIRWNSETASLEINDGSAWNGAGGATGMATGIVSAPGWAFTANTTTGIYQPSAGVLSFAAGGGEQFRIVNTANAVNCLTVTGNTGNNGPVLGAAGSATNIDIYFQPKGLGAVYAMNPAFGLIYGVYNDAGATANTQYLTFSNASTGNPPYVQANGTDATVDMHFRAKSATGKHVFGTTTNQTTLQLQSNASAVNYLTIQNAVAASAPSISAAGTDANISITLTPKGTGGINITSGPISVAGSAGTSGQVLTSGGPSASPTWTTVAGGGTPGGSTGQMQYNNAGSFAGASNVMIEGDNLKLMPLASIPTAPTDGLVMFDRIRGGRHLPSIIGPSGVDVALQPALFGNSVYMWLPGTGTTLGINWGTSFTARNSGTGAAQAHPTKTSTNAMTSMNRATFGTGTTTTGASGIQSSATVAWRGNAAGLGGFFFFARFGIETLATGQRAFVGLSANNATMVADPSSWNNTCGIGKDSGDTTWQIIMRGTSATKTNTGITVTAGQILDFAMFAAPNDSSITCRVADAVTGAVLYDNTSFTTNLPTNTTFLHMQAHTQSTSGTTAKLFALNRMYVETDL